LLNLVISARDAMSGAGELTIETGNVTLDAEAFVNLSGGDYLRIAVTDNGPGMSPEVAAHAFDPFFAINGMSKAPGLGLSQVYGFARRANGQARIVSRPGAGTRIEMYLPISAAVVAPPEEQLPSAGARPVSNRETVLVVEDNPDVLDSTVNGLSELGYQVKTATNAQAALDILRSDVGIEVLFSDVAMPGGMNGGQLAVEAQQIRPGLKVLLTSGYTASALSQDHDVPETLQVLPKPYGRDELASKLRLVIAEPPPRLVVQPPAA
jgi:CheY-like chemotaxis protein